MISKWEDMIIFYPDMIYFLLFQLEKYEKSGFAKQSCCINIWKGPNSPTTKHGKPTLHSLIANHVLEMSAKLKFKCERFKKKQCFALVVLNGFPICFYQGLFT